MKHDVVYFTTSLI